ncbi:hypothetical protein CVS40_9719 [Lucilia cuprina]|nr:hypothetical protein CVS40_9719 [Lucilia cuprina]
MAFSMPPIRIRTGDLTWCSARLLLASNFGLCPIWSDGRLSWMNSFWPCFVVTGHDLVKNFFFKKNANFLTFFTKTLLIVLPLKITQRKLLDKGQCWLDRRRKLLQDQQRTRERRLNRKNEEEAGNNVKSCWSETKQQRIERSAKSNVNWN